MMQLNLNVLILAEIAAPICFSFNNIGYMSGSQMAASLLNR